MQPMQLAYITVGRQEMAAAPSLLSLRRLCVCTHRIIHQVKRVLVRRPRVLFHCTVRRRWRVSGRPHAHHVRTAYSRHQEGQEGNCQWRHFSPGAAPSKPHLPQMLPHQCESAADTSNLSVKLVSSLFQLSSGKFVSSLYEVYEVSYQV